MIPSPWIVGPVAALLLALGGWLFWQGREAGELDRARDTIETRERIDDALDDCADRHWSERLRCSD